MKRKLFAIMSLLLCLSFLVGGCAAIGGKEEKERLYTPVALYFNPLEQVCPFEWVKYFPIFENYPDDWTKYGLHGSPTAVQNQFSDATWGISYRLEAIFNPDGKLYQTLNTAWRFGNKYNYNANGQLQEIIKYDDNNSYHSEERNSLFEYFGDRLEEWLGPNGSHSYLFRNFQIKAYRYEYYPDSTLKAVVPVIEDEISRNSTTGTYEFNEKGQLVRMTAPKSANPFLKPFDHPGFNVKSESEFKYNDKGLCISKSEKFLITKIRNGETVTDTLSGVNHYQYNRYNDLMLWIYDGVVAEPDGSIVNTSNRQLTIEYDYQYDDHGNWTTAWCVLPKDFESFSALAKFYIDNRQGYGTDSDKYGGRVAMQFERSISAYYDDLEKEEEKQEEMTKTEEKPKYTGAMAYGLQGPVKMVKNDSTKITMVFNKIGNIESRICKNGWSDYNYTYIYESPVRYKSGDTQYRIDIDGNVMKMINEPDEEIFEFEDKFEFDSQGRVIKHVWHEDMSPTTREFFYKGDSRLPYKEALSSFDETGEWSTTIEYKYVDIDKHGNWTKRIGTTHSVSKEYEDVQNEDGEWEYNGGTKTYESTDKIEETRKISYF